MDDNRGDVVSGSSASDQQGYSGGGHGGGSGSGGSGAGALLVPFHAFGVQQKVRDCIAFLDATHTIHPVGKYMAITNTDTKEMTFITDYEATGKVKSVSAIVLSPNKKFLALTERLHEPYSQISIINVQTLKKVKTLTFNEAKEISCLSFSGDSKYIAAQGGKPDWVVTMWSWEKGTALASVKVQHSVSRMTINPWDNTQIVTTGRKFLKIWRILEGSLQGFSPANLKKDPQNYTDHIWFMGDLLAVATDIGDILIFKQGEWKKTFSSIYPHQNGITSLVPLSKGFIAAGNGGYITIFERIMNEKDFFQQLKTIQVGYDSTFTSLCISPSETALMAVLNGNHFIQISLDNETLDLTIEGMNASNTLTSIASSSNASSAANGPIVAFSVSPQELGALGSNYHSGAIKGMDICMRKPLLVTCGADKTVRVWNYVTRKCELVKEFSEVPHCVAFHPFGLQIVVAFADKLRFFSLLVDDIRQEYEFPSKNCREVLFSNAGHLICAIAENVIHLYSSVSFGAIITFRGHMGQIRAACFSPDDKRLASVSVDGAIYEWSLDTYSRLEENVQKSTQYTAVAYTMNNQLAVAGSDKILRAAVSYSNIMEFPSVDVISSLSYSRATNVLFSGNMGGSVRSWSYPVTNSDVRDYNVHTGSIVSVRVSPTENFLFTASDDGAIFVMSILPLENGKVMTRRALDPSRYLDLVLTSRAAIEERAQGERELQSKLKEAQNNTEYQVHMRQLHFEQDLKKVRLEADQRLQQEVAKYEELRKAKMALELKAQEEIQQLEKEHLKAAQDLEQLHERRAKDAAVKLEELTQEKDDAENANEEHSKRVKELHATTLTDINREWEEKLAREKEKFEQLSREMDVMKVTHDEEVSQQEEEYEYEMAIGKDKANKLLQIERDNTMSLKSDNSQYRRKQDMYLQEFQELQNTITEKDNLVARQKKKMQELEDNIHLLNKEVEERNETIAQKESRIFEIKQKNQELEKFRFVLEYKINELREELEPQELTITDMRSQIKDMDEELQRTLKGSEDLKLTINDKKLHSDTLTTSVKRLKAQIAEKEKLIRTFVEDVHKIYTETDPAFHKEGLLTLYQTYVTGDSNRRITREDQERMQELARQRQYMERSLNIMKQKVQRSDDRNRIDVQRKVSENASLISELNNLRRLTKEQGEKIIGLENQLNSGTVKAAERLRNFGTSYINPVGSKPSTAQKDTSPNRLPVESPPVAAKRAPTKTQSATAVVPILDKEPLTNNERSHLAKLIMQREEDQRELELLRLEVKRMKEAQANGMKAGSPIKVIPQRIIDPVPLHPLRTSLDPLPLDPLLPNIKSLSIGNK